VHIDALVRAVQERYVIGEVTSVRRLRGGYANDVFLLTGRTGDVVLRIKYPPVDLDSIAWEHRLLTVLSTTMPEVPAPLLGRDGTTMFLHGRRPVSLMPYVPGAPGGPEHRLAVAKTLGRLHSTAVDVPERPNHPRLQDLPFPEVRQLPAALAQWLPRIREARAAALDLVRQLSATGRLRTGITHNDVFPGNILVHDGRVSALLDWEEADVDWLIWDLACGLWTFCNHRDEELDADAAKAFLDAYREADGLLSSEEEDLIIPLIRTKRILEVLRAPTDRDPRWDYQLANLHAYENLG
jgi:Ser/Thr protein kinase RdoA (MazF antagonist)